MSSKVAPNNFVRRQTKESRFAYYDGSFEEVVKLAEENFENAVAGDKEGTLLVPVPCNGFFTSVVEVDENTEFVTKFEARRPGEDPYIFNQAVNGNKIPAKFVDLVLYHHDVLAKNGDNTTDAEWELISINARVSGGKEPLTPITMARNFLELTGGSKAEYTAKEFAEAIIYWSKRAMCG